MLQPGRQERDVFPTAYRMNSRRALAGLLATEFDWAAASRTGLEQYLLPWPRLARTIDTIERHLPRTVQMALVVCARRRSAPPHRTHRGAAATVAPSTGGRAISRP